MSKIPRSSCFKRTAQICVEYVDNIKILCSLVGFPFQKGRHQLSNIPSWAEDQCAVIKFKPYIFYPHKKIYVQLTVNHVDYSNAAFVHEATIPWVESVNISQFTACVTRAGRNDYPSDSFATVDWIAYQGAPSGGVTGEEKFSRWWTGTICQAVTLPNVSILSDPRVWPSLFLSSFMIKPKKLRQRKS